MGDPLIRLVGIPLGALFPTWRAVVVCQGAGLSPYLASYDLRHTLVAHPHNFSNGRHRQASLVGLANSLVAVGPQLLASIIQLAFSLGVVLRKCR
jgi:hypothetical protein